MWLIGAKLCLILYCIPVHEIIFVIYNICFTNTCSVKFQLRNAQTHKCLNFQQSPDLRWSPKVQKKKYCHPAQWAGFSRTPNLAIIIYSPLAQSQLKHFRRSFPPHLSCPGTAAGIGGHPIVRMYPYPCPIHVAT